jgi:hypothetical protein
MWTSKETNLPLMYLIFRRIRTDIHVPTAAEIARLVDKPFLCPPAQPFFYSYDVIQRTMFEN